MEFQFSFDQLDSFIPGAVGEPGQRVFYLQARGIPEAEARRLVVRGFFADIINRIPVAELQGHLMQAVERELAGAGGGSGLSNPPTTDDMHHSRTDA